VSEEILSQEEKFLVVMAIREKIESTEKVIQNLENLENKVSNKDTLEKLLNRYKERSTTLAKAKMKIDKTRY